MGWASNIWDAARYAQYGSQPRPPTDAEREDWLHKASAPEKPSMPRGRAAVRSGLRSANPVRFRQIEGDIKWIQKHLKRMGLNPEDWKEYL